jgi:hypothetical protein
MGVGDGKRVNIPARPNLKLQGRGLEGEMPTESGRGAASARPTSPEGPPRKAVAYAKDPVP